jgi:Zn-dependent protease
MGGGYYGPPRGQGKLSFSPTELRHLGMAILILSVAFALALSGFISHRNMDIFIIYLMISFIIVSTGFALHEIAHKYVAQRYGYWAEFRYSEMGLFIALIFGFLGWIIAAPGAVYISGNISREENGKISAAGPLTNLGLTGLFWIIIIVGINVQNGFLILAGIYGALINPIIAGFNMIPIYPLDGSKIWRWNPAIYIFMAIIIVGLVVFTFWTFYY